MLLKSLWNDLKQNVLSFTISEYYIFLIVCIFNGKGYLLPRHSHWYVPVGSFSRNTGHWEELLYVDSHTVPALVVSYFKPFVQYTEVMCA